MGSVTTGFLKDLIVAGHLAPEMSYLASDPSKLVRARKLAMGGAREMDMESQNRLLGFGMTGGGTVTPVHLLKTVLAQGR